MSRGDDRLAIDPGLVRRMVARQFPHWAHLPVTPVLPGGWDNRSFRLGADLLVRLPSAARYAAQVAKEQRWLPALAHLLPLPIPIPLGHGVPDTEFQFPWSVLRWLPGEPAAAAPPADQVRFAQDLAAFLRALQAADATEGPAAGPHSFHRGGTLAVYDAQMRDALLRLESTTDAGAARRLWRQAVSTRWQGPPVWVHGDIAPGNLLMTSGRLSAVIDFGCCAVGDPACDLAMSWTFLSPPAREALRAALPLDDATWVRGAAWALWKALIVLAALPGTNPDDRAHQQRVLAAVLDCAGDNQ